MASRPSWVPRQYHDHWDRPWTDRAKRSVGFRRLLQRHGRLSPNFTLAEAKCKDGTPVPRSLRSGARNHAFNLEKLRHALGDVSMTPLSWYRTEAYNRKIGGAIKSQHVRALATDHSKEWVQKVGRAKLINAANIVFAAGGFGQYPAGSVHFDSRGFKARWTSFVGW